MILRVYVSLVLWDPFLHINHFLFINHLCNAPFWHAKLINVHVKPKPRKLDGNLLNFIASHPFSAYLFFLKHPVWNLCECCLFLNSSFMNHSPPATAREDIWLWCRQVSIHFLLKLHDVFFLWQANYYYVLWLFIISLLLWLHPTFGKHASLFSFSSCTCGQDSWQRLT